MRGVIVLAAAASLAMLAGCATAEAGSGTAVAAAEGAEQSSSDELICRRVQEIGTHLGSRRVCQTREQWNQANRDDQAFVNNTPRGSDGGIESSMR